jgi:hypothetical protein
MARIRVTICALDPITRAGLRNCLQLCPDFTVSTRSGDEQTDVFLAAFDEFTPSAAATLRAVAAGLGKPAVLLMDDPRRR